MSNVVAPPRWRERHQLDRLGRLVTRVLLLIVVQLVFLVLITAVLIWMANEVRAHSGGAEDDADHAPLSGSIPDAHERITVIEKAPEELEVWFLEEEEGRGRILVHGRVDGRAYCPSCFSNRVASPSELVKTDVSTVMADEASDVRTDECAGCGRRIWISPTAEIGSEECRSSGSSP